MACRGNGFSRRLGWGLLLTLGVFLTPFAARAEPAAETDRIIATRWLMNDCGLDDWQRLENKVKSRASVLEPMFVEAAENGPDRDLMAETERVAAARFDRRQKVLADPSNPMRLKPEDLEILRGISREQFIATEKGNLTVRYKAQAIAGLALVNGAAGRKALEKIAQDASSPVQSNAQDALKKLSAGK